MAEQDKSQKEFDATPQRLRKALEEGNVFRARELVSVGMLAIGSATLLLGTPILFRTMRGIAEQAFLSAPTTVLDLQSVPAVLMAFSLQVLIVIGPFLLLMTGAAFGLNVVQSGWNVTLKPLVPKANRVSPLAGLKRIFSAKGLFEFGKSLVKILLVGPLAYHLIAGHLPEILMLHTVPIEEILATAQDWIGVLLMQMIGALAVLSAADFAFEKWKHKSDLKMTRQEVRDEAKENEGNPEIKGKRRQLARELSRRPRLDHAVLQADVVVTNPTHYAVALRYAPEESEAPLVVCKGIRKRALRIKELAREHDVPTIENRPLARALYAQVEELGEVPPDLYHAVAAVLAEVYRMKGKTL